MTIMDITIIKKRQHAQPILTLTHVCGSHLIPVIWFSIHFILLNSTQMMAMCLRK